MSSTDSIATETDAEIEARLVREAAFQDHVSDNNAREEATKFYAVTKNSKDEFFRLIFDKAEGKDFLEYGCGNGSNVFDMARLGARVHGIDISPIAIEHGRARAAREGLSDSIDFRVMNAEQLDFPDNSFDRICGTGILHHLDLEKAFNEIARVLRPGGYAVFSEPLGHNPVINWYRNRTPDMRTPDEHPLMMEDFELARRKFPRVDVSFYHLTSLGVVPLRNTPLFKPLYALTESLDKVLMAVIPPLRGWAWMSLVVLRK